MRVGRGAPPVLAELGGSVGEGSQFWSIRRADFEQLTELQRRLGGDPTVLVSGGEDLAGSLAIALAGAAAAGGRQVALVECDLGRPRLAVDLGLAPTPGLHEYLRWEATPEQILQPLVLAGSASNGGDPLVCISAGRQAPDPGTLLGLQSFRHMTAKLSGAYDLVVLVGPALDAAGPGLAAIAARAEGVLVAVGREQVSGRAGRALGAALADLPSRPLGAVVLGV